MEAALLVQEKIWKWAVSHLKSDFEQESWQQPSEEENASLSFYLHFLEEERRLREEDILTLQEYSLEERVDRFRAIGPLTFLETSLDEEGRFLYHFQMPSETGLSKFREGDFLKLAPVGSADLQSGFSVIMAEYDRSNDRLSVLSRQGRPALSKRLLYSMEEDLTDWNTPKLTHVAQTVFSSERKHPVVNLFSGDWVMEQESDGLQRMGRRLRTLEPMSGLNATQRKALELPFRRRLSLIEGPPGTGKTYLLAWILIGLVLEAQETGRPLRITASALTHQAIDGVLQKVTDLINRHRLEDFPARVMKRGRWTGEEQHAADRTETIAQVEPLNSLEELSRTPYLILGSTGFGLYGLFKNQQDKIFPQIFDWVIFDEASQILVPQALLSLVYGKGNFLFLGDVKQLPPIILGSYDKPEDTDSPLSIPDVRQSVLALLLDRYGPEHRIRLDRTYRMNEDLCTFPSQIWYDGVLRAAPDNATSRLVLRESRHDDLVEHILNPEKPVALVLAEHGGSHQQSELETEIMAELAHRLMVEHGLSPEQLALISPHRAQNNATANRLSELLGDSFPVLPLIDTVERVQGAERDVILFAFTTSDPDHVTGEFLNNPNRFNVAITRARHKLIVVGSRTFFLTVPQTEEALKANRCFKEFLRFCRDRESVFVWEQG